MALQATQEGCLCFRIESAGPARLTEEVDGKDGFAQSLLTSCAAGIQVFSDTGRFIGAEDTQQEELERIL